MKKLCSTMTMVAGLLLTAGGGMAQAGVILSAPQGVQTSIDVFNFTDANNSFNVNLAYLTGFNGGDGSLLFPNSSINVNEIKANGTVSFWYSPPGGSGNAPYDPSNGLGPDVSSYTFDNTLLFKGALAANFGTTSITIGPGVTPVVPDMTFQAIGNVFLTPLLASIAGTSSLAVAENILVDVTSTGPGTVGMTITESGNPKCSPTDQSGCLLINVLRGADGAIGTQNDHIDGILQVSNGFTLVVPEPGSLALMSVGLGVFGWMRRKQVA